MSRPEDAAERRFAAADWWGKRLAAVHVKLSTADEPLLTDLLGDAWEGKSGR